MQRELIKNREDCASLAVLSRFDWLTALFAGDFPLALRGYGEAARRIKQVGGSTGREGRRGAVVDESATG
ncbi:hypothetical protein ACGGAQ_29945 [Micromonospora sp. NPDC047557]|uniref:hypothetical protein n=1 Tax=Micromonospora sp. NPDC047557 TaxID=3364250 RepID=UPI00371D6B84